MMWFDKHNPACLYIDKRNVEPCMVGKGRNARRFSVDPDMTADFTSLPFDDNSFYLIIWDPPHLIRAGEKSYMGIKYGCLDKNWQETLRLGYSELMRVLKPYGTLIFKWNETQVPTSEVIMAIGQEPLFGHISGRTSKTHWMTFMKLPDEAKAQTRLW